MPADADPTELRWSVVVPVKRREGAKTRLAGRSSAVRAELALAFARDAVHAALRCPQVHDVVVVTDDATAADQLAADGARVCADPAVGGLDAALRTGAADARRHCADCGTAALLADLPALTPDVLGSALRAAAGHPSAFVADADGIGTTLYAATPGTAFSPAFGGSSRRRHRDAGAVELVLDGLDRLRRDVDTDADLRTAVELGVGPRTRAVLAHSPGQRS